MSILTCFRARLIAHRVGEGAEVTELAAGVVAVHQQILTEVQETLSRAIDAETRGLELTAEDLRLASRALGRLTGAVDVEELLDIVFADFCIGK